MRKVIVLSLCLMLLGGLAIAREATLTRVDLPIVDGLMGDRTDPDCTLGNFDFSNILGHYASWWWGYEDYAYVVRRMAQDCGCSEGFAISSVGMLLALPTDTNLLVQAAVYSNGGTTANPVPGVQLYAGPIIQITGVPEFNYYIIELPTGDNRECRTSGIYFIVFRFLDDGASMVGLPVSAPATAGTMFNDWGTGWVDLQGQGFQGNIHMWGDVDCCWNAVPTEDQTWGSIKQLFR